MAAWLVFAAGCAAIVYITIAYPLILSLAGRKRAPVAKGLGYYPSVTVVVAVHNGEDFIAGKLECLLGLEYPAGLIEILVVSDGSTDATEGIVESFAGRGVRLLRVPRGGKPAALNAAVPNASGEILFFNDVRQRIEPKALAHLAANFADPTVGAVTGELHYLGSERTGEAADLGIYWRYELWARRRHSAIDSVCNTTGCIYAVRRSLVKQLPPDTLADDLVIPLGVHLRGYRVVVEPEAIALDYPQIEGGEFRRKLRTLAGLWQVHTRFPALFTRANRMRFHFLSHKSARLVLPWALIAVWAATLALPASAFRSFLLLDEAAFAGLAVLDWCIPKNHPLKRLTSPARTFLAMNAAALASPVVFLVPARRLWRPTRLGAQAGSGADNSQHEATRQEKSARGR
jgi:cellulose synthase/poly-beta-1,6-N-acetylglucosamine synthase-like glycosyltransferase